MVKRKVYSKLAGIITWMLVACMGFAQQKSATTAGKPKDMTGHETAPDKALLAKFEVLCKKMANTSGNYTLAGIINIVNKASPVERMDNTGFLFCKQGDEFYYKLGETATINEQGIYLFVDYASKRIIVSQQKKITYDAAFKQFGDLGATISGEHYQLTDKVQGEEETISLTNEHHISCKQYAITFNRQSLKIKRLFMRLTNGTDPLRTDNEKVVSVNITRWDNSADVSKYLTGSSVVKSIKGGWRTVSAFKDYQLVKM